MPDPEDVISKTYFTLNEANHQVAKLSNKFSDVTQLRGQLKSLYSKLDKAGCAPETFDGSDTEDIEIPEGSLRDYGVFRAMLDTLRDILGEVEALGCVVKNFESGLCDFYSNHQGRDIFLCWQYGEPAISHWHEIDDGFSGRRPIQELDSTPNQLII